MPQYRVEIIRACTLCEQAFVEIEADTIEAARDQALGQVLADSDSAEFGKEWLDDTDYYVHGAAEIKA
jgi:hypothetical protein